MKVDKFDDFIKNHRQIFDEIEPAPPAFKFEKKLVPASKVRVLYTLWAASVAVIFVLSFLLMNKPKFEIKYAAYSINKNIVNIGTINNLKVVDNTNKSKANSNIQKTTLINKTIKEETEENIVYEELFEADVFYTQEIKVKQNELLLLTSSTPQIYNAVYADISELEKIYFELSKDLKDNIDNQQVIEAMIQNYRLRLAILEGVVEQIKNQTGNNNNTKAYEL